MIEKELADEYPEAFELGAGIYKFTDLKVTLVLEQFRVLTVTQSTEEGYDRRLKGGAINSGTKYGKQIKKKKREKYLMRE
jgi:hypothetical protein